MGIRELKRGEDGAVVVLVAVMLVLILVCLAIVVDLGHIHNVKVQLQRAVDAAALAGAGQLDGAADQVARAKEVAKATAEANGVLNGELIFVDSECKASKTESCLGDWNRDKLGEKAFDRWTQTEDSPNAILVRVAKQINHIFFFPSFQTPVSSSTVIADAIAVAAPQTPVLPLAIVTCIPADKMLENPGSFAGAAVCDIKSYSFNPDKEDTGAWTSLTFNASGNEIIDYMTTKAGQEKFNKVIFGTGLPNNGIENEIATTTGDCFPHDYSISCGLGRIDGKDLAAPGDFPVPTGLPALSSTPGEPAGTFDPLVGFALNGALPRWYNLNDDNAFNSDDYFTRVWTQDGILIKGSGETLSAYLGRLKTYAECADASCEPYGDDRFLDGNLIIQPKGQLAKNLKDKLGFTPEYWPDFLKVINEAGYPKVGVTNGSVSSVLKAFVENPEITDGTNLRCTDNSPFPPGQKTLRVNTPVIFAGACENWDAISNSSENHTLAYIGLSKFLLTRVWTNHGNFDCGTESEVVQLPSGAPCSSSSFDPPLFNNQYFSLPVSTGPLKAFEGLNLIPILDDEDEQGSILKVYLVE